MDTGLGWSFSGRGSAAQALCSAAQALYSAAQALCSAAPALHCVAHAIFAARPQFSEQFSKWTLLLGSFLSGYWFGVV